MLSLSEGGHTPGKTLQTHICLLRFDRMTYILKTCKLSHRQASRTIHTAPTCSDLCGEDFSYPWFALRFHAFSAFSCVSARGPWLRQALHSTYQPFSSRSTKKLSLPHQGQGFMFWYRSFISRMAFFSLFFPTAGFQPQRSHWDGYMQPTKALCGHGCFCGFDMLTPPFPRPLPWYPAFSAGRRQWDLHWQRPWL